MSKLTVNLEGDTHIVVTRHFDFKPELVYRAHTDSTILPQWCTGPEGWEMPVCVFENKPGGNIRFEWANAEGHSFYLTGEVLETTPHSRIVHVERMFLPDATPDNHVVTEFTPEGNGTLMTMRMTVPDSATREMMLATGMTDGMETSYQRLEAISADVAV